MLPDNTIFAIFEDREQNLWVGTQDGLFRFDGRRFLRFGREEGLPSTRINVLYEAADGRLWVGTRGGLAGRDGARFRTFTTEDGVSGDAVPDQGIVSLSLLYGDPFEGDIARPFDSFWLGVDLKGADPVGKKAFNNSMGLMFDPNRGLVWAVGQYSHVHVLKLDAKAAKALK